MTDKQIIIDGVDVSGCPCIQSNNIGDVVCVRLARTSLYCEGQPCYYKALERKEQECEELKAKCKKYGEINEQETKDYAELKAENEELTTINTRLLGRLEVDEKDTSLVFNLDKELRQKEKEFYTAIQKVVKLKQTLTEIKEIAERDKEFCVKCNGDKEVDCIECIEGGRALLAKDILQKISEVEDGI